MKAVYEDILNNGKDPDTFAPYLAKNFVGVLATGDEVKSIDDLKAFWKRTKEQLGSGGGYTEKFDPDLTDFYGDIAIAHGTATQHIFNSKGQSVDTKTLWMIVAQKQNGMWKIIRAQTTMDPIHNAIVELMAKKTKWTFGLGGLGIGFIAGFLIFRRPKTV
jgi:ketosteroid isomerase-like protein